MNQHDLQNALGNGRGTIVLGGKTYLVGKPNDSDTRTIAAFLIKRVKSPVAAAQADPDFQYLSSEEQKEVLTKAAIRKFKEGQVLDGPDALRALQSLEGVRFLTWVCLRKENPDLSEDDVANLVTEANHERVFREMDIATGMASLGN